MLGERLLREGPGDIRESKRECSRFDSGRFLLQRAAGFARASPNIVTRTGAFAARYRASGVS